MPDIRAGRRCSAALALAGLVAAVATACAALPTSGAPQAAPVPSPQASGPPAGSGLIVVGPQPGWSPAQVVENFLLASAINPAIAREYLTRHASRLWRQPLTAVTILAATPTVVQVPRQTSVGGQRVVVLTGQKQATLNSSGQYVQAGAAGQEELTFALVATPAGYRIDQLPSESPGKPSHARLLTSAFFHLVYTARNLYYYGLRAGGLVPDPVYVPAEPAGPGGIATTLVNDLRSDPGGWLAQAARTAFPPAARLGGGVQVLPGPGAGRTAIVSLRIPARAGRVAVPELAAQLVTTLTSSAYGPALFQAVILKINGRTWHPPRAGPLLGPGSFQPGVPHWPEGAPVYYLGGDDGVRVLGPNDVRGIPVGGNAGSGQLQLTAIAVAPGGRYLAGLAGPATTVYTGTLAAPARGGSRAPAARLQARLAGARFTSLSWDSAGDLWVVGRIRRKTGVWVLPSGRGPRLPVHLPAGLGLVTGLRVAPDGVQAALTVARGGAPELLLAAISRHGGGFSLGSPVTLGAGWGTGGSGQPPPAVSAFTWYDESHLLAVTGTGQAARLWEVPANGDVPRPLSAPSGITSVTAAGPRNPVYVSLASGQVEKSAGLTSSLWTEAFAGRAAVYPG
jgi:hypothetical protein